MLFRAFLACCLASSITVDSSLGAGVDEQMAWTIDRYASDVPGNADTVILTYGIPQTDAVAFEAICGGPDGPIPRAVFWYDTIDLAEDQDVVLSLSVGDVTEEVPAKVYGQDAEVGISGVQAVLSASAPIWQSMMNVDVLSYGISGGKQQKLNLMGAANALRQFTAACQLGGASSFSDEAATTDALVRDTTAQATGSSVAASLRDRASGSSVGRSQSVAEAVSCDKFGSIKSARSRTPVKMTFINKADGYRGIVWIDTEGTPVDNTGLNQGETAVLPTFQNHAWMITDGPGNCIEMVVADEEDSTFEITAPALGLGPDNE